MSQGLSVSRLINVSVNLTPLAAQFQNFNTLLIAGNSEVIDVAERIRSYNSIEEVAQDFGTTAPEYLAAQLYFEQIPQPTQLYIGRWASDNTQAILPGGVLTDDEQLLSNFTNIAAGAFSIPINGTPVAISGLDFTGATNLNGVASIINTALASNGGCTWDGQKFTVTTDAVGVGSPGVGSITLTSNPTAADTVTVNGVAVTFVASGPSGNQVVIGSTNIDTAANLQAFLAASVNTSIDDAIYTRTGNVVNVTNKVAGTAGNSFTLAKSSTAIAVSGATLTGGTNAATIGYATTGISTLLKLTSTLASPPVQGINAETPLEAVIVLADQSTAWYALTMASPDVTDDDLVAISGYLQATVRAHIHGVSTTNTTVLSSTVSNDIASRMKALGYTRTFVQYAEVPYVAASFLGRALTVDFAANNSTITMMYKQEPGVAPLNLTATQADTLQSKRCNFFVNYDNNTAILQDGVMSGPAFFDEVYGLDWLQNQIQTDVYNLLYTTPTKVPQTDAGTQLIVNTVDAACAAGVNNALIAPGIWNSAGFGTLKQGDFLPKGYYIYAPPVALQAQGDREARKSVPIQVAVKLAGAIQTVDVIVNVNR